MSYSPYYTGGWQSGENGGTPITPAALNHIDQGMMNHENDKNNPHGTDYVQVGAAPAGYGIGGNAKNITGQDINTIVDGGRYYWDTAINSPFGYAWCHMDVIPSNGHSVVQKVWQMLDHVGSSVQRVKTDWADTAWTEWEWENPPMELGVEYRTTERWQGKAVYKKSFDLGALPNASTKSVAISFSPTRILSSEFHYTAGAKLYSHGDLAVAAYVGLYEVEPPIANITTTYDASGTTGYVTVRYTKD